VKKGLKKRRLVKPEELARAAERIGLDAEKAALGGELERDMLEAGEQAERETIAEKELGPGVSVYIPYLRSEGVVLEAPQKGRVRLAVGSVKLWAQANALRRGKAGSKKKKPPSPSPAGPLPPASRNGSGQELLVRTADNTLDVRGRRVDEALSMVERFADQLYRQSIGIGFVVHGYGTGALRQAVRERLRSELPYVLSAGPADFEQGGEAVTMFRLDI